MYKGGILKSWGKKQAVALHQHFYATLPRLPQTDPDTADIVWLIYDLELDSEHPSYNLRLKDRAYTQFETAIEQITVPESGPLEEFVSFLQEKLDSKLENDANPPDTPTLADLL